MNSGAPFSLLDLVDLAALTLGKARRKVRTTAATDEAFYEEFFTELDDAMVGAGVDPRKSRRLEVVGSAVDRFTAPGALVLDVGCGLGDTLQSLSRRRPDLVLAGVEYSRANVARATRRLGASVDLRQGSATAIDFAGGTFDLATCIEVLEHIEDESRALDEIARVLKPDAYLVMTVPYRHWFPAYRNLMGHHRHYDRESLSTKLEAAGFEVVEWLPNYPRWHRAADFTYIAARAGAEALRVLGRGDGRPDHLRIPVLNEPLMPRLLELCEVFERLDTAKSPEHYLTTTSCVAKRRA